MNNIDLVIKDIRRAISKVAESSQTDIKDLINFLNVKDENAYGSVIDSFYLLEDTQLAKNDFEQINLRDESFGRLYLFFYGVLNSCYMQQQAILVICKKLGIEENIKTIKNTEVVSYRNDFSAHSSNRGRGESEHSFILDRHAMREGKLKGYTANHQTGCVFKDENIRELIKSWDIVLEKQLKIVSRKVLISKT